MREFSIMLLKNAIIYSYSKTAIDICITKSDNNFVVTITNHGETIPNNKLEHIFNKYFRADENYQVNEKGTGLGLAIAKEMEVLLRITKKRFYGFAPLVCSWHI